jgi:hypothetical protein
VSAAIGPGPRLLALEVTSAERASRGHVVCSQAHDHAPTTTGRAALMPQNRIVEISRRGCGQSRGRPLLYA